MCVDCSKHLTMFHDAGFFAIPVTLFFGSAFIVGFLTLGEADIYFYLGTFPKQA